MDPSTAAQERWMESDSRVTGVTQHAAADHVIVAKGTRGDTQLADRLSNAGFAVHVAGDAHGVGYIEHAMRPAAELATAI